MLYRAVNYQTYWVVTYYTFWVAVTKMENFKTNYSFQLKCLCLPVQVDHNSTWLLVAWPCQYNRQHAQLHCHHPLAQLLCCTCLQSLQAGHIGSAEQLAGQQRIHSPHLDQAEQVEFHPLNLIWYQAYWMKEGVEQRTGANEHQQHLLTWKMVPISNKEQI